MPKIAAIRRGYISVDWLTTEFRYTSEVQTSEVITLWDILRDKERDYIKLENVYVSPISNPSLLSIHYPEGTLKKDLIQLVLLNDPKEARPKFNNDEMLVFRDYNMGIVTGSFYVKGRAHYSQTINLEHILHGAGETFFALYEATVQHATSPDLVFESPAMLINTNVINFYGIQ